MLIVLIILSAVVAMVICAFIIPRFLVPLWSSAELEPATGKERLELQNERLRLRNEIRTALLQGLGGIALLVGAYLTWQQILDNQLALRHSLEDSQRELQLTQESQITDRYSQAVEQIASDQSVDARVGGIYTLERIAKDSPHDRETITEVLTSYILVHSTISQSGKTSVKCPATASASKVSKLGSMFIRKPDVQAAAKVLGRRPSPEQSQALIVLREADLRYTSISKANLAHADLRGVHLERANLSSANLSGADLSKWYCNSHLEWAQLNHANLSQANLQGADFSNASLEGADLTAAKLSGAKFKNATANKETKWPNGFDPMAKGIKNVA